MKSKEKKLCFKNNNDCMIGSIQFIKTRERKHNVFIKDISFCFYDVCNVNSVEYESKHV